MMIEMKMAEISEEEKWNKNLLGFFLTIHNE